MLKKQIVGLFLLYLAIFKCVICPRTELILDFVGYFLLADLLNGSAVFQESGARARVAGYFSFWKDYNALRS